MTEHDMLKTEKKKQEFNLELHQNRINYLYQLSTTMGEHCPGLSSTYNSILKGLSQKSLLKIDPEMKRNICKKCNTMLIPGKTVICRTIKKSKGMIRWTCIFCGKSKTYKKSDNYCMWSENPNLLLQTIVYD